MRLSRDRKNLWARVGALVLGGLAASGVSAAQTRASLVLSHEIARPGDAVTAGLRLEMQPGWHTYWRNPGESGLATKIEWTLPTGITADGIQWPVPERWVQGGVTNYVYHDEVILLIPLKLAPSLAAGTPELKAKVSWLECETSCVPGRAEVSAALQVGSEARPSADAALFDTWAKRLPLVKPAWRVQVNWDPAGADSTRRLVIGGPTSDGFAADDFWPYEDPAYEVSPTVVSLPAESGYFRIQKGLKRLAPDFPRQLPGLLVQAGQNQTVKAVEVLLDLGGGQRGPTVAASVSATPATPTQAKAPPSGLAGATSLVSMLGLAFLGGLILNVMPCVLPVIALKILGFVQQSQTEPSRVRKLGAIYVLGVLVSFLGLAAVVIGVRAMGGSATWGMQMQNPYFRLILLVIVVLVALNLFGLFEVSLGGAALGTAAELAGRQGSVGAFLNGVLTTALATPCTAPFLTVALGFAFIQPAPIVVATFAATGLGLAAPYAVLSWRPGWLRFLPKAGPWMGRFKVAMGFPMLATAVWLFDLSAGGYGDSGPLWLGLWLVILALAAWGWGEFVQRGTRHRGLAAAVCLALLAFGYGYILEAQLHWRSPLARSALESTVRDSPDGIEWRRWTPAAVEEARRQGHPVLVDFTAKWCLTCQSNKRLAIDIPEVRARLAAINALAFRADHTDPQPAIAAELQKYDRAGVPLVLVFSGELDRPPVVLPALLTPGIVLAALRQAVP